MVLSQIMSSATKVAATDRYVKSRLMSGLPSSVATGSAKASAVNDVSPSLDHAARSFRLAPQPCQAFEPDRATPEFRSFRRLIGGERVIHAVRSNVSSVRVWPVSYLSRRRTTLARNRMIRPSLVALGGDTACVWR